MTRNTFIQKLVTDRRDAIAFLSDQVWGSYERRDLMDFLEEFDNGSVKLQPLHEQTNEELIEIADETVSGDTWPLED